jgi:hypothetical protein
VAAITTVEVLRPGLSLQRRGRSAGDYFEVKGEPRRRWWMGAAPELGLERNSKEDRTTRRLLIAYRVDPRDGQNQTAHPGQGRRARRGAIPGETRRRPVRDALTAVRAAPGTARERRKGVVYFDVINSLRGGESDRGGERGRLPVLSGRAWYCYA